MARSSLRSLSFVLLLLGAACGDDGGSSTSPAEPPSGDPSGTPVSSTIGSAGGMVASADGRLEIVIPAGALASDTAISVQPIAGTAPGAIGGGYRLGKPDAAPFAKPVTLRFKLSASEIAGTSPPFLAVGTQTPSGTWQTQPSEFDAATRVLSAETTHFSDWSALAGLQLVPGSATVRVGETLRLGIRYCRWTKESEDVLCPVRQPCKVNACVEDQLSAVTNKDWSVNGTPGGTDKTGRVVGDGTGATFTAPSKAPDPATVAVSVEAIVDTSSPTQLVSNVTITDAATYEGTMTFDGLLQGFLTNGKANVTFKQFEDLPDVARFEPVGGQFQATVNYPDCDPVANVVFPADTGQGAGTLVVNKDNNAAGKGYFWEASSKTVDVQMSCGSPRAPMTVPVPISIRGKGTYQDIKSLAGSEGQTGGGSVSWQLTRP